MRSATVSSIRSGSGFWRSCAPPRFKERLEDFWRGSERDEVEVRSEGPLSVLGHAEVSKSATFRERAPILRRNRAALWDMIISVSDCCKRGIQRVSERLEENPSDPNTPGIDPAGGALTASVLDPRPRPKRVDAEHAGTVRTVHIKSQVLRGASVVKGDGGAGAGAGGAGAGSGGAGSASGMPPGPSG